MVQTSELALLQAQKQNSCIQTVHSKSNPAVTEAMSFFIE